MSEALNCRTPYCNHLADTDISSQGYCTRCVTMFLCGVDPSQIMIRARDMQALPRFTATLVHIASHAVDSKQEYDAQCYDSYEQYLETVIRVLKDTASKALHAEAERVARIAVDKTA